MVRPKFSLLTTHFGEEFWVRQLLRRIDKFSGGLVGQIVVVNQNRGVPLHLPHLSVPVEVVEFPPDEVYLEVLGHDHPAVLQRATQSGVLQGENVLVLDSDCIPVTEGWSDYLRGFDGPVLAADADKWGLSHPCFMSIPQSLLRDIDFCEGVLSVGIDGGRLVGHQLVSAGHQVRFEHGERAHWGKGDFFFGKTLYHHGSGSLMFHPNPKVRHRAPKMESAYRRALSEDRTFLTLKDKALSFVRPTRF